MIDAALAGTLIFNLTYATIALIIVILAGKTMLYFRVRKSRFGTILLLLMLMMFLFLIAELFHLADMRGALAQSELYYSITSVAGFIVFALLMQRIQAFSQSVGFAQSDFAMALKVQNQLCTVCRRVSLKVPVSTLLKENIITPDGTLKEGVTVEQLVDRGMAVHPPHTAPAKTASARKKRRSK
jgi:hypothetical protein